MRKLITINLLLAIAAVLVFSSCERRPLEDEYTDKILIPIALDWTKADVSPQNVSALFYYQVTGELVLEHRFEHSDKAVQSEVSVPVGKYTVVFFNEIRDQLPGVGIRGHENLSTLEAYAKTNNRVLMARAAGDVYVNESDILATVVVRNFDVTVEMLNYTRSKTCAPNSALETSINGLTGLVTERKVHKIDVVLRVEGLNNARMPALADLNNLAASYMFDSDMNSMKPITHQFPMNNRTYDPGSTKNGTISATIYSFGVLGEKGNVADQPAEKPITLDLLFDSDKTIVNHVIGITNLIGFEMQDHGAHTLYVDTPSEDKLPDVVPDGSTGGSGLGADLIEWNVVDVPLIAK